MLLYDVADNFRKGNSLCKIFLKRTQVKYCGICGTDMHIYTGDYSKGKLPLKMAIAV
jgi:hypothetical protein